MHSTSSDGVLSPEALVEKAAAMGVTVMAITDHDTFDGVDSLLQRPTAIPVLPGVELSMRDMHNLHLLGYGLTKALPLRSCVAELARQRVGRGEKMARRLAEMGMPLDWPAIYTRCHGSVGRPHIARAMVEAGYAQSIQEVFERYLGDGGPAYVPGERLSMAEALPLMRRCGFVPVLAHPAMLEKDDMTLRVLLEKWRSMGLMGVEVYHPAQTSAGYAPLERMARGMGLLVTGGSDFHQDADGHGFPGCTAAAWSTAEEDVRRLIAAMEREKTLAE